MKTFCAVFVAIWTLVTSGGFAMDIRLVDHTIYATGPIEKGDVAKLGRLIQEHKLAAGFDDYVVRLKSPGGLLFEGMALGNFIREAGLETLVARGDVCASACALAFLGGTSRYATGWGVGRRMEFGASLGFHGFSRDVDTVRLESEVLSGSRIVSALILEYGNKNEKR